MHDAWIPLIAAIVGGILASSSNLISIWVQSRRERNREVTRLAVQAATEEFKAFLELQKSNKGIEWTLPPLTSSIQFHWRILDLLTDGRLNPERLERVLQDHRELRVLYGLPPMPQGPVQPTGTGA
jgi:hypothetical protein